MSATTEGAPDEQVLPESVTATPPPAPPKAITTADAREFFKAWQTKTPEELGEMGVALADHATMLQNRVVNAHQTVLGMKGLLAELVKVMAASGSDLVRAGLSSHPAAVRLRKALEKLQKKANAPPAGRIVRPV